MREFNGRVLRCLKRKAWRSGFFSFVEYTSFICLTTHFILQFPPEVRTMLYTREIALYLGC